jgi:predicted dehydrogenase
VTRIGIVGAGFMGTTHARSWATAGAHPVAIMAGPGGDPSELCARFDATPCDRLEELLDAVDVVDVCAPTHLHEELVVAAAEAGKHVICEKPLARTVEQGERMLRACDDAGVHLLVAHVVRFFPEYAAAKAAVDRGEVGTPAVLRLGRSTFQPRKAADNWFVDEAKSGGLVFDLMIHDIDYARWVAGEVTSVYARSVRGGRPGTEADHALAILRHADGALTHLEASWAYPPPVFRTRGEIAGDAGVVSWDSDRTEPVRAVLRSTAEAGEIPRASATLTEDPYTTQIRHFLRVIRGDATPIVTAFDGLASLRVAEAAVASITSGEAVEVRTGTEVLR